nr:protein unc-13 homolog D-like [Salvelinus alpinus]
MNGILQKQENLLRAAQAEREGEGNTAAPPAEHVDQAFVPERSSRREQDLLYEEAVYTVVNRVGVPSPEYITNEGDIFSYLLKVHTHF